MKRMILLCVCAIIGLTQAQAQLSFGVKAGANFSTISKINYSAAGESDDSSIDLFKPKYVPGFHIGCYLRSNFTPSIGVQAELLYSMMGYKLSMPMVEALVKDASIKSTMHYVDVPVLFNFTVPNTGLFFELGPQLGLFLTDKGSVSGKTDEGSLGFTVKKLGQGARLDVSAAAGLGYRLSSGIVFSARYLYEFKTSSSDEYFIPTYAQKRCFQVSLAYELF
jgi:hypothetical protein